MSKQSKGKGGNKKQNKNQTQGNLLIFYALQAAASSVLQCKVTARAIKFKSPVKAEVQYDCEAQDVSKEQQQNIADRVNHMLSSNTSVSVSEADSKRDDNVANGIKGSDTLYSIAFDGQQIGFSHITITATHLGMLSGFKMVKANFNVNKKVFKVTYQFTASSAASGPDNSQRGKHLTGNATISYFDDAAKDDRDDRSIYAKELMTLIGTELGVKQIGSEQRDKLFEKVHDVLNQFQNVCYTKGLKAASTR